MAKNPYLLGLLFTTAQEQVVTLILEDIISGANTGAIDALTDKLGAMGERGKLYRNLLMVKDPIEFNTNLNSVITSILFEETPTIEV